MHLVDYLDEVPDRRDICRAFDMALSIAGTSNVSMLNGNL